MPHMIKDKKHKIQQCIQLQDTSVGGNVKVF